VKKVGQKANTDREEEAPRTFRNFTPAERRRFHVYCSKNPHWRDEIERRAKYVIEKVRSNGQLYDQLLGLEKIKSKAGENQFKD